MGKYIIAIGGTGIRCLESFLHVSALNGFNSSSEKYNVLIVEGDIANGNKDRLQKAVSNYKACQNVFFPDGVTIDNSDKQQKKSKELKFSERKIKESIKRGVFKDRYNTVNNEFSVWCPDHRQASLDDMNSQANDITSEATKVLYSAAERETDLSVGFKGHPNIGSLTIDHLMDLDNMNSEWYNFLGPGNQEIKNQGQAAASHEIAEIFVVGSVFGGTGAAGIYSIVNKLLNYSYEIGEKEGSKREISYKKKVENNNMRISVCMMIPYFSLPNATENNKDKIFASNLMENTAHALDYYIDQSSFLKYISLFIIGKSNPEIMQKDESRGINRYASGNNEQKNKSMTPELLAALAMGKAFGSIKPKKDTINYLSKETQVDLNDMTVDWASIPMPTGVAFQEKVRDMLVFSLVFKTKIYPVFDSRCTDVDKFFWLGKCVADMKNGEYSEKLYADVRSINEYCTTFINWVLDIGSAGESEIEHYELFDMKRILQLQNVSVDDDVDYASLVNGVERQINWKKVWDYLNENRKMYTDDGKGLHRLVVRLYDGIRR